MKKLLLGYDGSDASKKAIEVIGKIAHKDDEIVLLMVIPAELVDSTFTKMLLPTVDMSSLVQSGSFKEKAMKSLTEISAKLEKQVSKIHPG